MGSVLVLLLVPIGLWLLGELVQRLARSPFVWTLFGFSLDEDGGRRPREEGGRHEARRSSDPGMRA